jgi:hypothetical protein
MIKLTENISLEFSSMLLFIVLENPETCKCD